MSRQHLIIFDVDGTLVDSQATIVGCATDAFLGEGLEVPAPDAIRRIVGLTLNLAMETLLRPQLGEVPDPAVVHRVAEGYRHAFIQRRQAPGFDEPLFAGARDVLLRLEKDGFLLGVATGKNMRGLASVLAHHGLRDHFVTLQTADRHPSKPHPSMIVAALNETGVRPEHAVMIGDTTFDIEMGVSAGVRAIGVAWGNHPQEELHAAGAHAVLERFEQLHAVLGC